MHLELSLGKALIPQPQVCRMLGKSRSGLQKLRENDPDFPLPVKPGHGRQARCYYVAEEIHAWLLIQISKRDLA
ncbi:transcriptional regulator [Pseudomonas sp.]|jgi:prophage regulatory protein|uniref:helix-turn-helix transcriptional regulator n=1 Tax=Pseudomonas sp. TaxID=306 RepID=UPI0019E4F876|nr:transcriptional regulator [Pseudomonas sp.]MBF0675117.1 transcriptional regulator [Pseudomonas sp.]MBF0677001.1 transcriptional regulator [Pseudomonas sp.]